MNLDIKKFKKIGGDEKHTILIHPNGHQIKIAHKGLTDKFKKELDGLPIHKGYGGPMMPKSQEHSRNSKPTTGQPPTMPSSKEASQNYTEPQDQGLEPKDVVVSALNKEAPPFGPLGTNQKQHYPPCINSSCKSFGKPHPNCRCYGGISQHTGAGEAGHFADGGEVDKKHFCAFGARVHEPDCEYFDEGGQAQPSPSPSPTLDPEKLASAQDSMRKAFNYADGGMPTAQQLMPDFATPTSDSATTPTEESPPIEDDSAIETSPTVSEPETPDVVSSTPHPTNQIDPYQKVSSRTQNGLLQEAQLFKNDLFSGKIKPESYEDTLGKSSIGKIGTLFGLLLSGAGSGLAHQPNMVMEMMNNEIERNMKAQQETASNQNNFFNMANQTAQTMASTGQINASTKATIWALAKSMARWGYLNSLSQNILKMPPGSPQRQQAEQMLIVLSGMADKEDQSNFALAGAAEGMAHMLGNPQGGGLPGANTTFMKSFGPPAVQQLGKEVESKRLNNLPPGVSGIANNPVGKEDQDQLTAMNTLESKLKDLKQYAGEHYLTLSPSERARADQKAHEALVFYNNSLGGQAITEGQRNWLDKQIAGGSNPTGLVSQLMGNQARLQEIIDSNSMRRAMNLKGLGFKVDPKLLEQTKTSRSGRPIVQRNGKWVYQ